MLDGITHRCRRSVRRRFRRFRHSRRRYHDRRHVRMVRRRCGQRRRRRSDAQQSTAAGSTTGPRSDGRLRQIAGPIARVHRRIVFAAGQCRTAARRAHRQQIGRLVERQIGRLVQGALVDGRSGVVLLLCGGGFVRSDGAGAGFAQHTGR